ncbi:MAG: hypothetical protein ACYC7E_13805 [Armatimonadota bacterium]
MLRWVFALLICCLFVPATFAAPAPLQTFTVKDYLGRQWTDEIVHFDIAYTGRAPKGLLLTDTAGKPVPCQTSGLAQKNGKVTGKVWTVVTLPPKSQVTLHLKAGTPAATPLRLLSQGNEYLLGNENIVLRLPRLPGALTQPVDLASLPAPVQAVMAPGGKGWLGQGTWINTDTPLQVKEAKTTVLEEGPVRVTVRYRLVFTDGRFYQADISLGVKQDVALFTDTTDVEAPKAAFRFYFQPGLNADRVYWRNNFWSNMAKGLTPGPIDFAKEQVVFKMYPWSFWWSPDQTTWAGFFKDGADPFIGLIAVRPSRWTPIGWDGFDRTAIPVTARPGGGLDISLGLLAWTRKQADGASKLEPAHRELAITMGTATEHVTKEDTKAKLRRQLIKYSEFPLDEVMRYGFDFTPAKADRKHPFLLFTDVDLARVRRQNKDVPEVKAAVAKAILALERDRADETFRAKGYDEFFARHYHHNVENWLLTYLGSDDPKYTQYLVAVTKGLRNYLMNMWVENPTKPVMGGFGPWPTETILRLTIYTDLLTGRGLLTPEEEAELRAANVFFANVLAHPDYWNTDVGICSGNPNMTSSIKLPLGLLGLYLEGHPRADRWLAKAEAELKEELGDWISPGGAWIECPGYQASSLDGIFLLAQALKQVKGRDYFTDPNFKATMEYYGQLLTPPDSRYPTWRKPEEPAWSTLPTIGDTPAGQVGCFGGWMAAATAKSDPAYSARQMFYWKAQGGTFIGAGRGIGSILAMTDYALPAAPPVDMSRAFPGFGSVMRTSWTDPRAAYLVHRTGPHAHHYHDDYNEILFAAKGAPLAWDFGNQYAMGRRDAPYYHNRVSFNKAGERGWGGGGELVGTVFLPRTIDYSYGKSWGGGNQQNHRHVLFIKSEDPLGANYLLVRDATADGQPNQKFYWNLFCLSKQPEVQGNVVHFPGQTGVDMDAHLLLPAGVQIEQDHWAWKNHMQLWRDFSEEMYGMRAMKTGSTQDFLALLYPRAAGQGPAQVALLSDGRGVEVKHMEGSDVVLLSPGKPATITAGDVQISGEIAYARRYTTGVLRLAVLKGVGASATHGAWSVRSDGPVALTVFGARVEGESSGEAHTAQITLPAAFGTAKVILDGNVVTAKQEKSLLTINLPGGYHTFTISMK